MPQSPPNSKLANLMYQATNSVLSAQYAASQSPNDETKQQAFVDAQMVFNNAVAAVNTELASNSNG